jgi:hypothetical protein
MIIGQPILDIKYLIQQNNLLRMGDELQSNLCPQAYEQGPLSVAATLPGSIQ